MRKLFKSTNLIKILLASFLLSLSVYAKAPRGVVSATKGNVFLLANGTMKQLHMGDYLYELDEVFTEVGASATIQDYYDNQYHLSGSGHVRIMNRLVELKSGYLWTQSLEPKSETFQVQTINASLKFSHGEFVISYEGEGSKTQVLSIKGRHSFTNLQNRFMSAEVSSGFFSFISENYENGNPRQPTEIGKRAYSSILSLFDDVKPLHAESTMKKYAANSMKEKINYKSGRIPASMTPKSKAEGSITVIRTPKVDEKRANMLKSLYSSKVKQLKKASKPKPKKFSISYEKKSNVSLKVHRPSGKRAPASVKSYDKAPLKEFKKVRKPASVGELNPQVNVKSNAFEASLLKQYKSQMRHSKEINSLINDLKSIDNDYDQAY